MGGAVVKDQSRIGQFIGFILAKAVVFRHRRRVSDPGRGLNGRLVPGTSMGFGLLPVSPLFRGTGLSSLSYDGLEGGSAPGRPRQK